MRVFNNESIIILPMEVTKMDLNKIFSIIKLTVYILITDLSSRNQPGQVKPDKMALLKDGRQHPDNLLRERADTLPSVLTLSGGHLEKPIQSY